MNVESWHILDAGSIWMKEFASAMAKTHSVVAWEPVFSYTGSVERWERVERIVEPPLELVRFPLQRGYASPVLGRVIPFEKAMLRRLRARCKEPERTALLCTTPFYAPVAEKWPGPAIYYMTDLTAAYESIDAAQVKALDRRLCRAAKAACPNSRRLAEYLVTQAGCPPEKITIVPNATRGSNVSLAPRLVPDSLPAEIAHLRRPVAGVIGNLAGNMDWELLERAIALTPEVTWVFVGPTDMPIPERAQAAGRSTVMRQAHFIGPRPYGELQTYARTFDVAVLPYRKREPTYSGSSTRFYEHLAACRPMLATRGFAELLEKPSLLELVDTPEELAAALRRLEAQGFQDGFEAARWQASREGTWEERVLTLTATIA